MTITMTQSNPLVTVVTVVYNDVDHIEQTIQSVLNQTYQPIEYIIIDGGSTDGTADKIRKYADRLAYWVSEPDKGIYDAMNKGISHAQGEWLNFMNSGDYFASSTVFSDIFSIDRSKADMLYGSFLSEFSGRPVVCRAHDLNYVYQLGWRGMPLGQQALFARTALMRASPFNLAYRVSADGDFVSKCIAEKKVFERLETVVFRVGTFGFSADHWLKARLENWQIARRYFPGIKTDWWHFQHFVQDASFRFFKTFFSWFGLYQLARKIYRKKLSQKISFLPKGTEEIVS